jgi:hypothetical protein
MIVVVNAFSTDVGLSGQVLSSDTLRSPGSRKGFLITFLLINYSLSGISHVSRWTSR